MTLPSRRQSACLRAALIFLAGAAAAACDVPTSPARTPAEIRHTEGNTAELAPVVGVACGYGWTGSYPQCEPPGGWVPGGSDPGAYTSTSAGSATSDPGASSAEGIDGLVLGLIVCLVGLGASGFSIYDVWDQTRSLLEDRSAMIAAENRAAGYSRLVTGETGGDQAMLEVLNYEAEQARVKYQDDVHQLAGKMHLSDYTLGASILGCGIALAAPTP